jgi:hypothetical protein
MFIARCDSSPILPAKQPIPLLCRCMMSSPAVWYSEACLTSHFRSLSKQKRPGRMSFSSHVPKCRLMAHRQIPLHLRRNSAHCFPVFIESRKNEILDFYMCSTPDGNGRGNFVGTAQVMEAEAPWQMGLRRTSRVHIKFVCHGRDAEASLVILRELGGNGIGKFSRRDVIHA